MSPRRRPPKPASSHLADRGGPGRGRPAGHRARRRVRRALGPAAGARARRRARSCCSPSGANPITYYSDIWSGGVELRAWQDTVMRMAPLLLIAVGLIVVFKAGIWNLGIDGQFLLAAAVIAGIGPTLSGRIPDWLLFVLFVPDRRGGRRGRGRSCPALLKARYGVNEIITTLMMTLHRHQPGQHPRQGDVPGHRDERAADQGDPVHEPAALDPGHAHPRGRPARRRRGGRHLVPDDPDVVRAPAGRAGRQRPRRRPRRHLGAAADRRLLRRQRGLRRPRGGVGDPRRLGLRPRRLEPGLRAARGPARLPRAAERARRHPVRRLPRAAAIGGDFAAQEADVSNSSPCCWSA